MGGPGFEHEEVYLGADKALRSQWASNEDNTGLWA